MEPAVQPTRPEPVRNAAAAASAITTVTGLVLLGLVFAHVITPEGQAILGPALASAVPTVVGAVSTLIAGLRARSQVTPLSAPISAAGLELVEATAEVADAIARTVRRPGPQTPGHADHAAPEE